MMRRSESVPAGAAPSLSARHIAKRFGEVVASDDISIDLCAGEVHCVLGENGAGKSTLIEMLAGMQQPDAGAITRNGQPVRLSSPAAAIAHGIGVVHQHSLLPPTMSVLDAIMLDSTTRAQAASALTRRVRWPRVILHRRDARARWHELSGMLEGAQLGTDAGAASGTSARDAAGVAARAPRFGIDPHALVETLGPGQRRQLELALALWHAPRVLILDEPSSTLSAQSAHEFLQRVATLTERGVAVLLVTHRIEEALAFGDQISVLRKGRIVHSERLSPRAGSQGAGESESALRARIIAAMFGADPAVAASVDRAPDAAGAAPHVTHHVAPRAAPLSPPNLPDALRLEGVSTRTTGGDRALSQISLSVRAGEIVGVAGIDGHGQRELAEVIAGQRRSSAGRVLCANRDVTRAGVRGRRLAGVGYVTADRLSEGIVGSLSVALNLVLKRIGERPVWRFGQLRRAALEAETEQLVAQYDIRPPDPSVRAGALSGGNIQKILLARELAAGLRVVVFDRPSTGLDLQTVRRVHAELRAFVAAGGAAIVMSPDLDELVTLSQRIVVLSHGRIVGTVTNSSLGAATGFAAPQPLPDRTARAGADNVGAADAADVVERIGDLMTGASA